MKTPAMPMSLSVDNLGTGHWILAPLRPKPQDSPVAVPTGVEVLLGRSQKAHIVCRCDKAVSALHCKLLHRKSRLEVEDLSTNGTHINGEKLSKGVRMPLRHGDILSITRPPDGPHGSVDERYTQFRVEFRAGGISAHKDAVNPAIHVQTPGSTQPGDAAAGRGLSRGRLQGSRRDKVRDSRTPVRNSRLPPQFGQVAAPCPPPAQLASAASNGPAASVCQYYELQGAYKVLQEQHHELQEANRRQSQRTAQLEQAQLQLGTWVDEAEEVHKRTLQQVETLSQQLSEQQEQNTQLQQQLREAGSLMEQLKVANGGKRVADSHKEPYQAQAAAMQPAQTAQGSQAGSRGAAATSSPGGNGMVEPVRVPPRPPQKRLRTE